MVGTVAVSVALAGLARSPCKEHVRGAVATKGVETRVRRVAFFIANQDKPAVAGRMAG